MKFITELLAYLFCAGAFVVLALLIVGRSVWPTLAVVLGCLVGAITSAVIEALRDARRERMDGWPDA